MRKVINKRLYDTEKAQEVCYDTNGLGPRDFHHVEETLYRKRTGEFFLHGVGGPASKYAESCGQNTWSGGERIIPLSFEAAREWVEKHGTVEEYEKIFGEVAEDDSRVVLSVSVSAATAAKLKQVATEQSKSVSAIIDDLVMDNQ